MRTIDSRTRGRVESHSGGDGGRGGKVVWLRGSCVLVMVLPVDFRLPVDFSFRNG